MRISLATSLIWGAGNILDIIIWSKHFSHHMLHLSEWVFYLRTFLTRIVGFVDAIVLGGLCSTSRGSGDSHVSNVTSMMISPTRGYSRRFKFGSSRRFRSSGVEEKDSLDEFKQFRSSRFSFFRKTASVLKSIRGGSFNDAQELSFRQRPIRPGAVRMLVTTWNMGGVSRSELEEGLPAVLPTWMPKGYDLYVS